MQIWRFVEPAQLLRRTIYLETRFSAGDALRLASVAALAVSAWLTAKNNINSQANRSTHNLSAYKLK
jgi:hypothetical protein